MSSFLHFKSIFYAQTQKNFHSSWLRNTARSKEELTAYLFDRAGNLVRQAAVKNNVIETEIEEEFNLRELRLVVIPDIKRRGPDIENIEQLERNKPYEASLKIDAAGKI